MASRKCTSLDYQSSQSAEHTLVAGNSDNDPRRFAENVSSQYKQPSNTPSSLEMNQKGLNAAELQELLNTAVDNEKPHGIAQPTQSDPTNNEELVALTIGEADVSAPIRVVPEHFESFKKWASDIPQESLQPVTRALEYKTVLEKWDDKAWKYEAVDSEILEGNANGFERYIFVVRERHNRKSAQVTRLIDVKSIPLCNILRKVLRGVRAVDMIGDKPSIEQSVLIHFLPELKEAMEEPESASDCSTRYREHLSLLLKVLTEANLAVTQNVSSLLQNSHITFDLLWALFKPGCHVFTNCLGTGKPRCVIFDSGEFTGNDMEIYRFEARYLDHDGEKLGEAGMELAIMKFRGSKPITSLDAFPIQWHPNRDQMRQNLLKNGRKFQSLVGNNVCYCHGTAFIMENEKPIKITVDSCVGVDAAFFYKMQPNYSRPRLYDDSASKRDGSFISHLKAMFNEDRISDIEKLRSSGIDPDQMSEDELLICSPTVCGFSFQNKAFMEFAVDDLTDMQWSPESFDCLSIPEDSKKLILSMVESRLGQIPTIRFDDFVSGKGLGLNILLHGPPGVGKTSTVEAAAQHFKRPLYSISAGELGVDHSGLYGLDGQLKRVFQVAKHFKALLLFDEADVWMEHRVFSHGNHNRLVTVILHHLEYYDGILFLTTNRATEIDKAVLSRIHIKIPYSELPRGVRREIWELFLSKAETHQGPAIIDPDEMGFLESLELNGRDIKNLMSIAHTLATYDGEHIRFDHLIRAAKANDASSKQFETVESMYI